MATRAGISAEERRWLNVLRTLNEAQARLFVAEKALELGRGGVSQMARLTGMTRPTITKGIAELRNPRRLRLLREGRQRRSGAGRRKIESADPGLRRDLEKILEEATAGDPMGAVKWTSRSTRGIAEELGRRGHTVSSVTVARCLKDLDYSLQANRKTIEGKQHPDRDAQFRYLNRQIRAFARTRDPVVSVDTKKKELIGAYRNAGRVWRPKGQPEEVLVHDFPDPGHGKAIPYGTYDVAHDRALVNVGISHDTAEFAVESIRRWWRMVGRKLYPQARRLLICADAGGSNGPRVRAWKLHLQGLATETGLPITVCHYPPGTSKWNKVEHRL
ncbi:MAG TPA: ISAzo13 family transposase, partial [Thermoanaerobaculia bacterium]|nr:ISAzo13 family transposase [Thermoanaerobaculia bacterium]